MEASTDAPRRAALRTIEVARAAGYSVQQVRDLERLGVLPPAVRAANGYRSYTPMHVIALRAYRGLARAVGPVAARRLLAQLRTQPIAEAAAALDAVHASLARERDDLLLARRALRAITSEGADDPPTRAGDAMTITELAVALGVRPSTLRFWEDEGLVSPERVTSQRARRYDPRAIGDARIVAALRASGYGIPAVRAAMEALAGSGGVESTERILQARLDDLATRSIALLQVGADLAAVVTAVPDATAGPVARAIASQNR